MELKRLISESPIVRVLLAVALIYFLFSRNNTDVVTGAVEIAPNAYHNYNGSIVSGQSVHVQSKDVSTQLAQINFENQALEQEIRRLLLNGEFKKSTTRLLEVAAFAIRQGDKKKLGIIMLLLGKVATNEQELDTAEVYLQEALDIALQTGETQIAFPTHSQPRHNGVFPNWSQSPAAD